VLPIATASLLSATLATGAWRMIATRFVSARAMFTST
jgi:hypothetical protein